VGVRSRKFCVNISPHAFSVSVFCVSRQGGDWPP
jgi:hypothetical protein